MPDSPYADILNIASGKTLNPSDRVHRVASQAGIPPVIADDYLKLTQVESGQNVKVRNSPKGARGFGQVMPDVRGGSTRTIGGRAYDLRDPDQNIEAGLRYFAEGGVDPVARRLHYFGGPKARQHYERTGRVPNISDGNLTATQYVQATGGQQRDPYADILKAAKVSEQTPPPQTSEESKTTQPAETPVLPTPAKSVPKVTSRVVEPEDEAPLKAGAPIEFQTGAFPEDEGRLTGIEELKRRELLKAPPQSQLMSKEYTANLGLEGGNQASLAKASLRALGLDDRLAEMYAQAAGRPLLTINDAKPDREGNFRFTMPRQTVDFLNAFAQGVAEGGVEEGLKRAAKVNQDANIESALATQNAEQSASQSIQEAEAATRRGEKSPFLRGVTGSAARTAQAIGTLLPEALGGFERKALVMRAAAEEAEARRPLKTTGEQMMAGLGSAVPTAMTFSATAPLGPAQLAVLGGLEGFTPQERLQGAAQGAATAGTFALPGMLAPQITGWPQKALTAGTMMGIPATEAAIRGESIPRALAESLPYAALPFLHRSGKPDELTRVKIPELSRLNELRREVAKVPGAELLNPEEAARGEKPRIRVTQQPASEPATQSRPSSAENGPMARPYRGQGQDSAGSGSRNPQDPLNETAPQPMWQMSPEQLRAARDAEINAEKQMLTRYFGDEAKRVMDLTHRMLRGVPGAEEELNQLMRRLTPEQDKAVDGWYRESENRPGADDYNKQLRQLEDVEGSSGSESAMADWLVRAIPRMDKGQRSQFSVEREEGLLAQAQVGYASRVIEQAGLDRTKILEMVKARAQALYGEDAEFMLDALLKTESRAKEPARPSQLKLPPPGTKRPQATATGALLRDEQGNPLTVYHHTTQEAADAIARSGFDLSKGRARLSDEAVPDGVFFTPSDKPPFSDPNIKFARIDANLQAENPLHVEDRAAIRRWGSERDSEYAQIVKDLSKYTYDEMGRLYKDLQGEDKGVAQRAHQELQSLREKATRGRAILTEMLKREGYDSLIMERDEAGPQVTKTYVALDPQQVKIKRSEPPNQPPPGDTPPPSTPPPTPSPSGTGGQAERSFPKSAEKAGLEGGENRTYDPLTNEETLRRADKRISEKGANGAAIDLIRQTELGAEDVVTGIRLMQKFTAKGDIERAVTVAEDLAFKLTKAGQSVQAASVLARLSPEGILMAAQKRVPKGQKVTQQQYTVLIEQAKRVQEAEARVGELQQQIEAMELKPIVPRPPKADKIGTVHDRLTKMEQEARARLDARKAEATKLGPQSGASTIPLDIADYAIIGAAKVAQKGMTLAKWSNEMVKEFGEDIRPQLKAIYKQSYQLYSDQKKEMKTQAEERAVIRNAGGPVTSEEMQRLIEDRARARKDARTARAQMARLFNDLSATPWGKAKNIAVDALGVPRSLKSTLDLSAPRQGAMWLINHPVEGAKTFFGKQIKAMKETNYDRYVDELESHPDYALAVRSNLALTTPDIKPNSLTAREEAFMSRLAGKLPGVKHSERAYTTFLDTARFSWFVELKNLAETKASSEGRRLTNEDYQAVANFVNIATGRGNLGHGSVSKMAPLLNALFFAPRFAVSKVQIFDPRVYARMPAGARAAAMRQAATYFGAMATAALLLKYGMGAQVGTDPEESEFMKLRVGNTRYDLANGTGQYVVLAARLLKNAENKLSGKKDKAGRSLADNLDRFLRYKYSPPAAFARNIWEGKNAIGEKTSLSKESLDLITPLFAKDLYDAYKEEGWTGVGKTLPGFVGVGVNTYGGQKKK